MAMSINLNLSVWDFLLSHCGVCMYACGCAWSAVWFGGEWVSMEEINTWKRFRILYVWHLLLSNMGVISAQTDDSQVTVSESTQMCLLCENVWGWHYATVEHVVCSHCNFTLPVVSRQPLADVNKQVVGGKKATPCHEATQLSVTLRLESFSQQLTTT